MLNHDIKFFVLSLMTILLISPKALGTSYDDFADKTYRKYENSITFQLTPSTYPLDWQTSRSLLFSLAKNRYFFPKTHSTLGHVTSEINCTVAGQRRHLFIGSGPKDLMGFKKHILGGMGFSLLNHPGEYAEIPLVTIDGRLDSETEDMAEYSRLFAVNNFGALTVLLDQKSCVEALNFAQNFSDKTQQTPTAGNRYGFGADPEKFEGAGCAPLAQSVMAHAGLMELFQKMERILYVPSELLGNPEKGIHVSVLTLLMNDTDMSQPSSGSLKFVFPDPQLLYDHLMSLKAGMPGVIDRVNFPDSQSILVTIDNSKK